MAKPPMIIFILSIDSHGVKQGLKDGVTYFWISTTFLAEGMVVTKNIWLDTVG